MNITFIVHLNKLSDVDVEITEKLAFKLLYIHIIYVHMYI